MAEKEGKTSRKTKALETKNRIYECARRLIEEYGFNNVTVDSIVEKAGVSKGSFYVHFSSKHALIEDQISSFVNQIDYEYKTYFDSLPDDTTIEDKLVFLAGKVADTIEHTVGYETMKILYEAQLTKMIQTEALLSYNRLIYELFSHVVSQGIQQGEFRPEVNIDIISNHCVMSLRGITYEWCVRYPDFSLKQHVLERIEIIIAGIKKQS